MAGQTADTNFTPQLTDTQQDLLLAALSSNKPRNNRTSYKPNTASIKRSSSDMERQSQLFASSTINDAVFASPQQVPPSGTLNDLDFGNTPYLDYLDGDASFDFDDGDLNGQMIGALPGDSDKHDKRKNPGEEDEDEEEGDSKRREGDDKQSKKPGRKPLTSEPTTKRKAQNRAAQRAFRERKEHHLKTLETKVTELTKVSEAERDQNRLLKAQIDRLQTELDEYRKRLNSDASRNRSSTTTAANGTGNSFAFDFPAFGTLPGSQFFGAPTAHAVEPKSQKQKSPQQSATMSASRQNSSGRSISPKTNGSSGLQSYNTQTSGSNSSGSKDSQTNANLENLDFSQIPGNSMSSFAGLFSPSLLNSANYGTEDNEYGFPNTVSPTSVQDNLVKDNGTDSHSGLSRVFRFNSGSVSSNTDSPYQSSLSQFNAASSCDTSPEPSHPSPPSNNSLNKQNVAGANHSLSLNNTTNFNALDTSTQSSTLNNFDWLTSQNGGQFDPVLFGNYRESQDAIIGGGEFNNGFFNDAFPFDVNSPFNFGDVSSPRGLKTQTPAPAQTQQEPVSLSEQFLANVEKQRDGVDDDYGLPSSAKVTQANPANGKLVSCNTIWNQLQNNKDFQDGKFDLDGLCSELRAKAKCSESGVVIPEEHVQAAFKKLGDKTPPTLMAFDQNSVDGAIKKLGGTGWPALYGN